MWGRGGKSTLGVIRALAKFRQIRERIRRRKALRFMAVTAGIMFVTFVLTLQAITACGDGQAMLVRLTLCVVGTTFGLILAFAAFLVRLTIARWPLPVKLAPPVRNLSIQELVDAANTGDIILFSYPVRMSGFFSGFAIDIIETFALKLHSKTQWTHVGIVLCGPNGNKYLCEATTDSDVSGHVGPGICRLSKRLENSYEYDYIAWRRCCWTIDEAEKMEREQEVFRWILSLYGDQQIGRYRLDIFRATGKIAADAGFKEYGRLMIAAGYPFEFDCAYFASSVLLKLGILSKKPEETFRILSIPHFCVERQHESEYNLEFNPAEVCGYEDQVRVMIPRPKPKLRAGPPIKRYTSMLEEFAGEHVKLD